MGLFSIFGGGDDGASAANGAAQAQVQAAQQAAQLQTGYLQNALNLNQDQFNLGMTDIKDAGVLGQIPLAPYSFGGLNAYDMLQQSAGMATLKGGSFNLQQALAGNKTYQDALGKYNSSKDSLGGIQSQLAGLVQGYIDQRFNPAYAKVAGNIGNSSRLGFNANDINSVLSNAQSALSDIATAQGNVAKGADAGYAAAFSQNSAQIQDLLNKYKTAKAAVDKGAPVNSLTPEQQQLVQQYNNGTLNQSTSYDSNAALNNFYNSPLALALFGKQDATKTPLENFKTSPGYQFTKEQGLVDLEKRASARGLLESGSLLKSMDEYNTGLASNEWNNYANQTAATFGNYQNQLANIAGMGANANSAISSAAYNAGPLMANYRSNLANNASNIYGAMGQTQANSALAQGGALAGGITNAYNIGQTNNASTMQGLGALGGLFGSFGKTSTGGSAGGFKGALGGAANGAATGAALGPYGAAAGGILGGIMGAFS